MLVKMKINTFVKGYQVCKFETKIGECFLIKKVNEGYGVAFRVFDARGRLGHLEKILANILANFECSLEWYVFFYLYGIYMSYSNNFSRSAYNVFYKKFRNRKLSGVYVKVGQVQPGEKKYSQNDIL